MLNQARKEFSIVKGIAPNVNQDALFNDKRKVFLFGSPSYTNMGDQAIAYAEEKFIEIVFHTMNILKLWIMQQMKE